jgi:hypothetical protein
MTADRLIRFYPRAWRERYGAEFVETVGSGALNAQQVIDIAMGAVDAWLSADVRRSSAGVVAGAVPRGGQMTTMSKILCRDSKLRMTTRDGLLSAAAMLASTLVIMTVGVMLRRSGSHDLGDAVVSLAFPMSMLVSMPFGIMKGQPWKAQALVLGVTFAILMACGYLSLLI